MRVTFSPYSVKQLFWKHFQVKLVTDAGLVIFCWGDDNNDRNTIKKLKEMGLHAVIYDKLDQYTTKEVKVTYYSHLESNQYEFDYRTPARTQIRNV